jgi:glutamate synthase domain-containing protein 2/glutamate synthase domain-containing protein 1/glutamate synthase domain-containing protein 3
MREKYTYHPGKKGLYDFANEHDACGVGFVANTNGEKSHQIIEKGIRVLEKLMHRGAVGGDNKTGDGAGILMQLPDEFFQQVTKKLDISLPKAGEYGVGMIFLPKKKTLASKCIKAIENAITNEGFEVLGWRDVPVDLKCLGKLADDSCPDIKQVFIGKNYTDLDPDAFERKLYVARRMVEKKLGGIPEIGDQFYVVSLSAKTIVYKGLLLAPQMAVFFPDLVSKKMKSALALVHQRYSTNTFPTWPLAQPFRFMAHNGEINTLRGNINQMRAREQSFESEAFGDDIKKLLPIIPDGLSDSGSLDTAIEFIHASGRSIPHTMMMLIPEAWGEKYHLGHDLRGFFEYHAGLMEPWDGPAAVAFSDGRSIGALLDRNGLRPARYTITNDGFIVLASEAGVLDIPEKDVKIKGCLRPGQMIYVDIPQKRVLFDDEIKHIMARQKPYRRWVNENKISLHGFFDAVSPTTIHKDDLWERQTLFSYSREELKMIIKPMADTGHEATGSMGNDAALAILSEKPQLLFAYFKQLFAQVTNPPIDPIREDLVMSLMTFIGNQKNILEEKPSLAHLVKLKHPILTNDDIHRLRTSQIPSFRSQTFLIGFDAGNGKSLEDAVEKLNSDVEKAVNDGITVVILSDKNLDEDLIPIPSMLAAASVNRHLVKCGIRTSAGLVIETGEAREVMHFALLLGYGATAVNPYLAFETIADIAKNGRLEESVSLINASENYVKAICKGLLKIMSKMGISTLRSYRGSQIFEAVGLNEKFIDKYFAGTASRIGGIGLDEVAKEAFARYSAAYNPPEGAPKMLATSGQYHFRNNGEKHLWTPDTIAKLQKSTRNNDYELYKEYAAIINNQEKHLCTLRGLFKFKKCKSISIDKVEPASEIVKRFVTGAMSFGSISKEAHETLAIAMNRIGGMSNSGEGGEDPARYIKQENGDNLCSAIKQIASGRFGVTAEYLASAKELQIKVAQGAKPGEGGQLPGHKVVEEIARVRYSTPGVTLISPPPHHDIYSIEDLAQLIYDLKNSNPEARISVKLVSEVGVGTVAAGVSKAHSDMVLISGHDGGTGASPLTSIKHTGLPWELGLAETQQTLVMNNLRDRIRVQVDGQLKTGRDVVIGAMLGAEEFGFATTALVVCGCVMMRKCHSNTCPVGVATQDPELRKLYTGKPEYVINFLMMIAEEIREYMAELGFRKLDDIIGRSDLLEVNHAIDFWKTKNLDFSKIFEKAKDKSLPVRCLTTQDHGIDKAYDVKLIKAARRAIEQKQKVNKEFNICNMDRTAGAMLSNQVAKKYGNNGLPEDTINFTFNGCAGQSFGAFLSKGITFKLIGEANDYVGKGLSGGKIILVPPKNITYDPSENVIAGNVLLYGATSGEIYIQGYAGERFAIRNSGVKAVVEGVGDHCCEYMTGGRVVILGKTGINFAAGMSGGLAYVYDKRHRFDAYCNLSMVDLEAVTDPWDIKELKGMITKHVKYTGSPKAQRILDNWESELPRFVKVFPMEYRRVLGQMMKEDEAIKRELELT